MLKPPLGPPSDLHQRTLAAARAGLSMIAPLRIRLATLVERVRTKRDRSPPPAIPPEPIASPPGNPLLQAASPLLALLARVPGLPAPTNIEELRQRIIAALRRFQSAARASGISPDQMRSANFILCATLDDAISQTDWGRQAEWLERGLLGTFHQSITAGPALETLIGHMRTESARYRHELELARVCIALGLQHPREGVSAAILRERGAAPTELSPSWRGIAAKRPPLWTMVPPWGVASVAAMLLACAHLLFSQSLTDDSQRLYQQMSALLPDRPAVIVHREPTIPNPARIAPTQPLVVQGPSPRTKRLQEALAREPGPPPEVIATRDGDVIRIGCGDAFSRAGATLTATGLRLVEHIAAVIDRETGRVLVIGHTGDAVPRASRFPTALELSQAQARAAARVLVAHLALPQRVDIEGRGDTEPLVPSRDTASRVRNCRIEILLAPGPAAEPPAGGPAP